MPHRLSLATLAALVALAVSACGGTDDEAPREVVLVTHDSFALTKPVRRAFERESGYTIRILKTGDAVAALNRALLTAGKPEGTSSSAPTTTSSPGRSARRSCSVRST